MSHRYPPRTFQDNFDTKERMGFSTFLRASGLGGSVDANSGLPQLQTLQDKEYENLWQYLQWLRQEHADVLAEMEHCTRISGPQEALCKKGKFEGCVWEDNVCRVSRQSRDDMRQKYSRR